jgi:type II secretory pathway component PulK
MTLKLMNNKKGSAFLYVTMAVFIVILMGGMVVSLLTSEIRVNKITEKRIEAKYLAEAGIEHAMLESVVANSETISDEDGNILYAYSYSVSGGIINITSYGYLDNKEAMKIDCNVRNDFITEWKETPLY